MLTEDECTCSQSRTLERLTIIIISVKIDKRTESKVAAKMHAPFVFHMLEISKRIWEREKPIEIATCDSRMLCTR